MYETIMNYYLYFIHLPVYNELLFTSSELQSLCQNQMLKAFSFSVLTLLLFYLFRTAGSVLGTGFQAFISDWDKVSATVILKLYIFQYFPVK